MCIVKFYNFYRDDRTAQGIAHGSGSKGVARRQTETRDTEATVALFSTWYGCSGRWGFAGGGVLTDFGSTVNTNATDRWPPAVSYDSRGNTVWTCPIRKDGVDGPPVHTDRRRGTSCRRPASFSRHTGWTCRRRKPRQHGVHGVQRDTRGGRRRPERKPRRGRAERERREDRRDRGPDMPVAGRRGRPDSFELLAGVLETVSTRASLLY